MALTEAKIVDERQSQVARPLLPPRARRPAALVSVGCIAITIVLGVITAHSSHPGAVDRAVDAWIQRGVGGHRRTLHLLEDIAEPAEVAFLTLAVVVACLVARRVNGAVLTVGSLAVSVALTEFVLKPLFDRTLDGSLVYPSGHANRAFTLAAVLVVLLLNPPGRRRSRALTIPAAAAAALVGSAVAVAMIGLNYHYFTDAVGGAALAIAVVAGVSLLLDAKPMRRRLRLASPDDSRPAACPGTASPSRSFRRPCLPARPRT
ncbi:MAG TPA: phosphatase PAP2 family protein [Streptosporangiaceae bacterium]